MELLSKFICPPRKRPFRKKRSYPARLWPARVRFSWWMMKVYLDVFQKTLPFMGYKVILAQGGEEAVEVYKKNRDQIDLVLLDMIMPGVSGGKVFDLLREMNPEVKVILSSGYSIDGEASKIIARDAMDSFKSLSP